MWLKTWEGEIILDYPSGSSALQEAMSQSSDRTVEAREGRSDEGTGSLVATAASLNPSNMAQLC